MRRASSLCDVLRLLPSSKQPGGHQQWKRDRISGGCRIADEEKGYRTFSTDVTPSSARVGISTILRGHGRTFLRLRFSSKWGAEDQQQQQQRHYAMKVQQLRQVYRDTKAKAVDNCVNTPNWAQNTRGVFANSDLDLSKISGYGFDYDYTLAVYTRALNRLIYNMALTKLVEDRKYPDGILSIDYSDSFAVRGLHFDPVKGLLFKLDAYAHVQKGTVYRGYKCLSDEEVERIYRGHRIPMSLLGPSNSGIGLKQLADLFTLPEVGLICSVIEYFHQNEINFDTVALFNDVQSAVRDLHISGQLHTAITGNFETYLHKNHGIRDYLERLNDHDKVTFVVTNSPFPFMLAENEGMKYMIGDDWQSLFHYVVVSASKPRFFQHSQTPFRRYLNHKNLLSWEKVSDLERGKVYAGDPMLKLGWRTGAIVPELGREITALNTPYFREKILWLQKLTGLIETYQDECDDVDTSPTLDDWLAERNKLRNEIKHQLNPQFGSTFRTFHNPSYFSARLLRLADIYTSRVPNLLRYSVDHTFYPRRWPLPHEPDPSSSCSC